MSTISRNGKRQTNLYGKNLGLKIPLNGFTSSRFNINNTVDKEEGRLYWMFFNSSWIDLSIILRISGILRGTKRDLKSSHWRRREFPLYDKMLCVESIGCRTGARTNISRHLLFRSSDQEEDEKKATSCACVLFKPLKVQFVSFRALHILPIFSSLLLLLQIACHDNSASSYSSRLTMVLL